MTKFPYYSVEITSGNLGQMTTVESKNFVDQDLLKAREEALNFAFQTEGAYQGNADDPSLVRDTPALIPMLVASSTNVSLVVSEKEAYQIYGEAIHDTLGALVNEACFYEQSGLVESDKLIKILQNTDEQDDENEPFELASFLEELPEYDFVVIEVLPNQLGDILRNTYNPWWAQ